MTNDPDIVQLLKEEEKLGKLKSNTPITKQELELDKSNGKNISDDYSIKTKNEILDFNNFVKDTSENDYKVFSDLMEIINFTEKVSTRLHGDLTNEEIIDIVINEFKKSDKYTGSILLLSEDGKKLGITGTSSDIKKFKNAEKISGYKIKNYEISLEKSKIYSQVIYENKTVNFKIIELLEETLPKKLAFIVSKTIKLDKNVHVATPLILDGKIIGAFAMSSTMLHNYFIPSVKNLALHISHSLEHATHVLDQKNTRAILSQSEQLHRTMIEKAPLGIFTVDTRGIVTSCNEAFIKMAGYSKSELIGKNIVHLPTLLKREIPKYLKFFKSIIRGNVPKPFKFNWMNKSGTLCTGELFVSLIKIDNKITGIQAVIKDISETQEAKIRLRDAEERYNSLFDGSMDLVYICDFRGRFIDANKAALELLGYNVEDIKSLGFSSLLDSGQLLKAFNVIREIKKNGYQKSIREFKLRRKNGEYIYVESISSLIFRDGKPYAIQGIARDITERKLADQQLRESEENYRNIVELAPDGMVTVNIKGIVNSCNPAFTNLTGYSKEDIVGKHITELPTMRKREIPKYLKLFGSLLRGNKQKSFEFEWIHKDGSHHLAEARASLLKKANKIIGMQAILRDITEQKKAEKELHDAHEKLKSMNQELERKVEERTVEINKLLKQKDEFINQLGHDLKNPLTPITNLLPLIKNQVSDNQTQDQINIVMRNVDFMKNLVIKTIELAKLSSPNTEFILSNTNLADEVNGAIEKNKTILQDYNIEIIKNLNEKIIVSADKLRLGELFDNIITNAVKYSPNGGIITFDAWDAGKFIKISVKDLGIGLNEEQKNHIFDEFYKVDKSRHDFESSGLGLTICKRIVEKHGGHIWAESLGHLKGTTINFTLPKPQYKNNNKL